MLNFNRHTILEPSWVVPQIEDFLREDAPSGDITTEAIVPSDLEVIAEVQAVDAMIFAGVPVLKWGMGPDCHARCFVEDGDHINAGTVLAEFRGLMRTLLMRERVLLNLLQRLSGIATTTRDFVDLVAPLDVKMLDTRKTTPGLRRWEKYAVAVGGGYNHRLDLSSGILVKDNHLSRGSDIRQVVVALREARPAVPIELEVEHEAQIDQGLEAGVDGFLLDNMSPERVAVSVARIRRHPNGKDSFIEASGGITRENVVAYARTGVDGISSGALTQGANSRDIRLEIMH